MQIIKSLSQNLKIKARRGRRISHTSTTKQRRELNFRIGSKSNRALIDIYRLAQNPIYSWAPRLLAKTSNKIKDGFFQRKWDGGTPYWKKLPIQLKPVWIHVSSGEFEYVKPLLKKIKEEGNIVLISYFSPTYKKNIESHPDVDYSCFLPFDIQSHVKSFLDHVDPTCLIIARTDLWPEFLYQCSLRKIPTLLFAFNLDQSLVNEKSRLWRMYKKWVLNLISEIHCVSKEDLKAVKRLGVTTPTIVTGDTRYEQVINRLKECNPIKSELFGDSNKNIVFGSTEPGDLKYLFSEISSIINIGKKVIWVPHEPTQKAIRQISQNLAAQGIKSELYSKSKNYSKGSVLIVDKLGVLAEIYKCCKWAFIGGSFQSTVHSVMESLAAGCVTCVGPFHRNNREAIEFKSIPIKTITGSVNWVTPIKEKGDMVRWIEFTRNSQHSSLKKEMDHITSSRLGASQPVFDWLKNNSL